MFLCCTSQGVDIVVKWLISLVVTSNHKCLNKIVSNKLALIIFEPRPQPRRWYSSKDGLGAVLLQKGDNGKYHPIAYGSKALNKSENNYHSLKLEFLA